MQQDVVGQPTPRDDRERILVNRVIHPDLFGRQRGKQFPATPSPRSAIGYSKMSLAEDLLGVPVDEHQFPSLASHPDLQAYPDSDSVFHPSWEPDATWLLSRLREGGRPSALCSRSQLERAVERMKERHGLEPIAAGEPEFYLFERDTAGRGTRTPYSVDGVSYSMDRITDPRGAVGRMHRRLVDLGIGVTAVNREFSPGQFEINVDHAAALIAADRIFVLKAALKELAIIEGLEANFMAKPLSGGEGSSLHVHLSLFTEAGNALDSGSSRPGELLRQVIGGLQTHAAGLTALSSPTVNSYKRLHGNGLSPAVASWGFDDRHVFARVPAEHGAATRVEVRSGDASANPYLLIAAMIYAAADGITRDLQPSSTPSRLPATLGDAISAFEADETFVEGFGSELVEVYAAIKRREIRAYDTTVTDWEWDTYRAHV